MSAINQAHALGHAASVQLVGFDEFAGPPAFWASVAFHVRHNTRIGEWLSTAIDAHPKEFTLYPWPFD